MLRTFERIWFGVSDRITPPPPPPPEVQTMDLPRALNYGAFRSVLPMLRCTFRIQFEAGLVTPAVCVFGEGGLTVQGPRNVKTPWGVLIFLETPSRCAICVTLVCLELFGTYPNLIRFLSPKSAAPLRGAALLGLGCIRGRLGYSNRRSNIFTKSLIS